MKHHSILGLLHNIAASAQAKLTVTMPHIHWFAPSLMIASLITGTIFALCHHLFYASLHRKHASTSLEGYNVLGTHVSIQQFNTAVGTAFAFLVRSCLMFSISFAYFQIFIWSVGRHGTKGTTLVHLDVMTSALQDLMSLVSFRTWWRRPWLWVLAVVAWYEFSSRLKSHSWTLIRFGGCYPPQPL